MEKLSVTVPEAVGLTGIGRSSLYKIAGEGKITLRKQGRRTLILVADLKSFLERLPAAS
jgi:excisionase family DNA binding protein